MSQLSVEDVNRVARYTMGLLKTYGFSPCLFGSAAARLHGTTRCPNDVDIVVMHSYKGDPEILKRILCRIDPTYLLQPSLKPDAEYKVLQCSLSRWHHKKKMAKKTCKVDVLILPILDIPLVPADRLQTIDGLEVMLLFPLLLLKLKGWEDNVIKLHNLTSFLKKPEKLERKRRNDVQDVKQLLEIARRQGVSETDKCWLTEDFLFKGRRRADLFVAEYPDTREQWEVVGVLPRS